MPRVLNIKHLPNFKPGWSFKRDGLPPGAVYIGRSNRRYGLPQSKWGNPFELGKHGNRDEVIGHFNLWLYGSPEQRAELVAKFKFERWLYGVSGPLVNDIRELRGFDLVCWCAPESCHGDLLLRLANEANR